MMQEQFLAWWKSISEREQKLFSGCGAVIILAILYWGIYQPLKNQLEESQQQLLRAEQTLDWVQDNANVLVKAGVNKRKTTTRKLSLTQIVNKSAKQHGITFSRIVNKKQQIEVWVNEVEFDRFVNWLTRLNNDHGVEVINADFTKTDKLGHIKINRLLLGY